MAKIETMGFRPEEWDTKAVLAAEKATGKKRAELIQRCVRRGSIWLLVALHRARRGTRPLHKFRRSNGGQVVNEGVKAYLAEIGRRGGRKSRRKLTKAQARAMVSARMAKRALRQANAEIADRESASGSRSSNG